MAFVSQNPKMKENNAKRSEKGPKAYIIVKLGTKMHKCRKFKDLGCNLWRV